MATESVSVSSKLKSLSKRAYCHQCQVTKRAHELKLCSRCQGVKYCSQACQKAHWKIHRLYCKSPEDAKLETDDESWKFVSAEFGHKKTSVLAPVSETLEQQHDRFKAWVAKWKPTVINWAIWAMHLTSSSTREDKLTNFTFVFELQRRADPATAEHYFEMHGAEIMHTSELISLLNHMKRIDILEEWRQNPRRKDIIQIMIMWKGHIIYLERTISNFKDLRTRAQNDPMVLRYNTLAKNWVEELRKAIDSADPEYHQKFYNQSLHRRSAS